MKIPEKIFGVPVKGAIERALKEAEAKQNSPNITTNLTLDNYQILKNPILNLDWYKTHEELKKQNLKMLTPMEFNNLLNLAYQKDKLLYNEITELKSPYIYEWLDAYFEQRPDGLYILTNNKSNSELLEPCLMEKQTPGISLEDWMKNPTKQGLPKPDIKNGNLYYWNPIDGRVAGFYADSDWTSLNCNGYPSNSYGSLGVRKFFPQEIKVK